MKTLLFVYCAVTATLKPVHLMKNSNVVSYNSHAITSALKEETTLYFIVTVTLNEKSAVMTL